LNSFVSTLAEFHATPKDVILVCDGENSKARRLQIYPEYKAGRSDDSVPERYVQFERLLGMIKTTLKGLGGCVAYQNGMEADDVLAYFAKTLSCHNVIVSNDGDMLALISDNTSVWTGSDLNKNKYGPFPPKFVGVYKALVGDPSDNYGGAKGFGEKAFLNLYACFGDVGLTAMETLMKKRELKELAEDITELPLLQKILDSEDKVYQSYDLARFYDEKVNARRTPLVIEPGMVQPWNPQEHDSRLKQWYGQTRIVTPSTYDVAMKWAMEKLRDSEEVFLDIETSSVPESDEWMAQKKRTTSDDSDLGVDVLGHRLTSLQLTFGTNNQYTLYFPVENVETDSCKNCTSEQVRDFVELIPCTAKTVIQNVNFELPVLYLAWGKAWSSNPEYGFLPNVIDTKLMASHVNENERTGLKECSKRYLGYDQVTYEELLDTYKVKKMNQLTAEQAFPYAVDDTICTAALYNYYRLVMDLEGTWEPFLQVEVAASYLVAYSFVRGVPFSLERMLELEKEDDVAYDRAFQTLSGFLRARGWEGTSQPVFDGTPASIKELYRIVTSQPEEDDDFLKTRVRTPLKMIDLLEEEGLAVFAALLRDAIGTSQYDELNKYVGVFFTGAPKINLNSPKQVAKLLYETAGLPVRLHNKPTDKMKDEGNFEGSPSTDALAIQYALIYDQDKGSEIVEMLKTLQLLQNISTRRKLYYGPYRHMRHWSDGKIHSSIKQSAAVTRRFNASGPNVTQLPKHAKATGEPARFRECFLPHKPGAVVFPPDFSGQELRLIADYSQDPNMLACFIGKDKKNMHALTAAGIARKIGAQPLGQERWLAYLPGSENVADLSELSQCDYDKFVQIRGDKSHKLYGLCEKGLYPLGKKTNFTTEYGAAAPKLARTLIITEEEAQQYIDAKLEAFPGAEAWKKTVIEEVNVKGYETTMMGARRHLAGKINSGEGYERGRAERQAVNVKIQGSGAEMIKLAMGRIWRSGILFRYDAEFYFPVHDELVFSVVADERTPEFIREVNALMIEPYAAMKVPIIASISVGKNYGEQIECGDEFELEKVKEGLQKALGQQEERRAA
jgi:DNA polymerase I-like protein with 3'-5' exonuclease and polymerase domains